MSAGTAIPNWDVNNPAPKGTGFSCEKYYKGNRQKQDTEAVRKFTGSSAFKRLMGEEAYHDIRRQMQ